MSSAKLRVAFQGELGSYSEEAAAKFFGQGFEPVPMRSLLSVFTAVEAGAADYGVVPIENSIEGGVGETYDLLLSSGLRVVGEVYVRVVHCLIGLEGAELSDIRRVYSHPQALAQCRAYITMMGFEPVSTYDTAGAVKLVKEMGDRSNAAIASERAATIYGMKVLAKGIEDYGRNYTRFLVMGREALGTPRRPKTSVIFSVPHRAGALFRALEPFAVREINLTKIESRPTRARPWQYYFFVDFEGDSRDERVREALAELASRTLFLKVLGTYESGRIEAEE
ncbi:MAG: prephenate dehydratase [Nitrososphaerota archaeon]|nr:prephenate dehydratase [Candidatus Calditenuis fumarioli]